MKKNFIVFFFLLFVILSAIFWYEYFNRSEIFVDNSKLIMNDLDYNNEKQDVDGEPVSFEPYNFEIVNNDNKNRYYTLQIVDLLPKVVNDGCNEKTLLKREQLKYKLFLNNKLVVEEEMSKINKNILDSRSILRNSKNKYKLVIFINKNNDNMAGMHYHYKINLFSD